MSVPPIDPVVSKFRKGLRDVLGQSPFLNSWVRRKGNQLADAYLESLSGGVSRARTTGRLQAPAPLPSKRTVNQAPLRRLLMICDSTWEREELLPELRKICETTFVDVRPQLRRKDAPPYEELNLGPVLEELKALRGSSFDAVFVYLRPPLLAIELLDLVRAQWSCPLLGWNLDCKVEFESHGVMRAAADNYRRWAGAFDCNLTSSRSMLDVYTEAGFPVLYVPPGCRHDPAIHKVRADANFEFELTFLGSIKPERQEFISQLRERGIPVKTFGRGWENATFVEKVWPIYQNSQLNLGLGFNVPALRTTNLKNRDFECPGAGGCYVTTYDWELAQLFEVGKEILCYRSVDDFVEIYSYYIRRPEECLQIAKRGFERCVRDHTWEKRFRAAFGNIGFRV